MLAALAAFPAGAIAAPARGRAVRALVEEWPPYLLPDGTGAARGLDAELLDAICQQAGFEAVWVHGPAEWPRRRYQELLDDRFDVVFSATPVTHNLRDVMYTRAYRQETMMVAAPTIHDPVLDLLRGYDDVIRHRVRVLCLPVGGLGAEFERIRPQLEKAGLLVSYPTSRQGIDMLRAGRASLIVGDALELQAQSQAQGFGLVRQPYGGSSEPVSLMLSRKRLNPFDLATIDRAISDLERQGVLDAIRSRYQSPPGRDGSPERR